MIAILHMVSSLAATPAILDEADAQYLIDSRRPDPAIAWYRAQMQAEPSSSTWLIGYLRALSMRPALRSPLLGQLTQQWWEAHPEDGAGGVAVALGHGLAAMEPNTFSSSPYPSEDSGWCEAALSALSTLPADPTNQYKVLYGRLDLPEACGVDQDAERVTLVSVALNEGVRPYLRAWFGMDDGIDAVDLEQLQAALADQPYKVKKLAKVFDKEVHGDSVEAAQALVLKVAQELVASDRPSRVEAAASFYRYTGKTEQAIAALERLSLLDPDNAEVPLFLGHLRSGAAVKPRQADPEADTMLDPASRLAALQQERPGKSDRDQTTYWTARADAARALGDDKELLSALDELWRVAWSTDPNLQFAEQAVAMGERLRVARRAMEIAVDHLESGPPARVDDDGSQWRAELAKGLGVQALVHEAMGDARAAAESLERALVLAPATPERRMRLGILYAAQKDWTRAEPLLTAGLAHSSDTDGNPEAMASLVTALNQRGVWGSGDVKGWLAARVALDARQQTPSNKVLDGSRFDDFEVVIGGETVRLLDIEGPVVVDLWATWCGPCMKSLPHLETLTRQFEGQVTFVAVSVDADPAVAERYLSTRGGASFVQAFAGKDGMERLGVSGIPAMFVFDGEHRLVARLSGWGPGSTALDDAVANMLGE